MELEARSIVAGYGGDPVLGGVSLHIRPGEMVALLGPNGSGKSTLIRCLSRTLKPDSGEALAGGHDLYGLPAKESARRVAVVPQQEDPVFDFTVWQIVEMGRFARGGGAAQVQDALVETRLEELANRPISSLSGGERQRVLLARALAQETPIMLLDEPTAHMDVGYQIAMLSLVRRLAHAGRAASAPSPFQGEGWGGGSGRCVLAALHDLNLASGFADRAVLLHHGRIVAEGAADDVLQSPEIERVYGAAFQRIRDERSGRLVLIPEFVPEKAKVSNPKRVHIIGGGGSAAALITELWQLGHVLSVGITNSNDSDCETARRYGVPVVSAPPFSAFTEMQRVEAADMARTADVILVTAAPYGPANLENLRLAAELAACGKEMLVVSRGEGEWDFTGGEASQLAAALESSGARIAKTDKITHALD